MKTSGFNPVSRVMSGPVLVASIIRQGNGRPGSPVRWVPYWSPIAQRLGAPTPQGFTSRHEAEAAALLWAARRLGQAAHVERAR